MSFGEATHERSGVLCAGSIVVDVGKVIDRYPSQELLAVIEDVTLSTGGPAVNLAVDLHRLGAGFPLAIAGVIGDDAHADFMLDALRTNEIDASGIRRTKGAATSFTDAMVVRDGGSRTFFHHPGANAEFGPNDVPLATSTARILHMGAPGLHRAMDAARADSDGEPTNGWPQVFAAAQALGMRTNLELVSLAPDELRRLAGPCLPHLDYLVINEVEATALAEVDLDAVGATSVTGSGGAPNWPALEDVARRLIDRGVARLVAVHFPAGCVAAAPGGQVWRHGSVNLPRTEIVSSTGAGDAFASGVIHGLHDGWPVEECLRAGVSAAAACLRSAHTSDGVLPLAECLAMAEEFGYR